MPDPLRAYHSHVIALPSHPVAAAFSPDGAEIAIAAGRGVFVADVATRSVRCLNKTATGRRIRWLPQGVFVVSDYQSVRRLSAGAKKKAAGSGPVIDQRSSNGLLLLDAACKTVMTFPSSGCGDVRGGIAALNTEEGIAIVEAATGAPRVRHTIGPFHNVALSPDGTRVVVSGHEGSWEGPCEGPLVWLPEQGAVAHAGGTFAIGDALFRSGPSAAGPFAQLPLAVEDIAFSPAGDRVCVVSVGEVRIVDLADLPTAPPVGPTAHVEQVAVDDVRGRLAAIDKGGVVCVWSLADAKLLSSFRVTHYAEAPIAWARDGHLLVGGRGLAVWDVTIPVRREVHHIKPLDSIQGIHVRDTGVVVRSQQAACILDATFAVRATTGPWDDTRIEESDVSPDGSTLYVTRGHDHPALAFAMSDGQLVRELPPSRGIAAAGTFLALATPSGSIFGTDGSYLVATDGSAPEPMERFSHAVEIGDAVLAVDGTTAFVRARGEPRWRAEYADDIFTVAASRNAFFTGGRAIWVAQRSLEDGHLVRVFGANACGKVIALAFDPSGTRIAVGEMDCRLHVWSLGETPTRIGLLDGTSLQPAGTIREPGALGEISALAFPGPLVACALQVMIWDGDLAGIGHVEPRTTSTSASRVSRDGRRFISGDSWGQEIAVFDDAGDELSRRPGTESSHRFSDVTDDGSHILNGSHNDAASEITIHTDRGVRVSTLRIEHAIQAVTFDSRGRVLGLLWERATFFRWDPVRGTVERWCAHPQMSTHRVNSFARGGGRIVLWGGATSYVLDEETGSLLAALPHADRQTSVTGVAVSNDGRLVALGDWSGIVRIFDIDADARCVAVFSATAEGGWWSLGSAGFRHVPNLWKPS